MTYTDHNQEEWDIPHEVEEIQLPEWPRDALPELAQRYVEELSRSIETPIELATMLFLSAVATASQKNYEVEIYKSYREPVNIWSLAILPPGARKSKVFDYTMSPILLWEEDQCKSLAIIANTQISKQKTFEEKIKHLRRCAAKANESRFNEYQKEIEFYEKEIDLMLIAPRLWTSDVTPEHLGTLMAQNDEAMAILSDEGAIFDILGGLYSKGRANIDLILKSYSGGSVRVDRSTKPPILLKRALLSMGLTVQPEVIKNICKNKTFRGRGLLGRFLFVFPPSNIGYRTFEEGPVDEAIIAHYNTTLGQILSLQTPGNNSRYTLELDSAAYSRWLEYSKSIERMMSPELDYLSHITDWAGKLSGQIIRIAGLLHIYRHANEKPWLRKISIEDMQGAVKIGHALIGHALKVFSSIYEDENSQVAQSVLQWIKNKSLISFSQRDCQRAFRRYDKKTLRCGLDILKADGLLHETTLRRAKGAPSIMFEVNPECKNFNKGQKGQ